MLLAVAVVSEGAGLLSSSVGAAIPPAAVAEPSRPLQGPQEYLTRTITYTYDPLGRLTGAEYHR